MGGEMAKNGQQPHYYKSWGSYSKPPKPEGEITFEEAQKLTAYYVAYFDEKKRLISFAKFLHNVPDWSAKYFYSDLGYLEKEEISKPDGTKVINQYDSKGKILK
jgi:hypothetical protein